MIRAVLIAVVALVVFATGNARSQSCSGIPNANSLCAGPSSGGAGFPLFRPMVSADIPTGTVANSNLANVAAGTVKCRETGNGTGSPQDCSYPTINVTDAPYSADPTGTNDSTTAIQNAINALPLTGGDVVFPCGTYKVSSSLMLGNGTNAAASTRYGMILRGVGNSRVQPVFPGFNTSPCVSLLWSGTATTGIIEVAGPLQTWGIQNIEFNCNNITSAIGVQINSAQFGDSRNLSFVNCFRGISSTTYAAFGSFTNTDSFHNDFYGTSIQVPATSGAIGILLTGAASTSNTDYNTFIDTNIFLPISTIGVFGIYLQVTDTDNFINTHLYGGNTSAQCVAFDYSVTNVFPSAVRFTGIDPGGINCNGGAAFSIGGTPGSTAKPHQIWVDEANGGSAGSYTSIVNAAFFGSHSIVTNIGGNNTGKDILGTWSSFTPSPSCGTATFTTNSSSYNQMGKTTFVQFDITVTALGTCNGTTVPFTLTLPNTPALNGGVSGRDAVNGHGLVCSVASGSTTLSCGLADASTFASGARPTLQAVYSNQ